MEQQTWDRQGVHHDTHLDLVADVHDGVHSVDPVIADVADVQQASLAAIHLQERTVWLKRAHNSIQHLANLQQATDTSATPSLQCHKGCRIAKMKGEGIVPSIAGSGQLDT